MSFRVYVYRCPPSYDVAAHRPGIRLRPLAANRQTPRMPIAAVRLQFFQAIDIRLDTLAQFAFHRKIRFDEILDAKFRPPSSFARLLLSTFAATSALLLTVATNTVHIRERDFNSLVIGNVYAEDTHCYF
jgi:hypothetical protein